MPCIPFRLRISRLLLWVSYIGLALFGVPATPPVTLLTVAPALGAAAAGLLAATCYASARVWPARRTLATTGAAGAALLPFVAGIGLLGEAGGHLGLVVLGLATIVGGHAVQSMDAPGQPDAAAFPPPATAQDTTAELLAALPLPMLLQEWHDTGREPARSADGRRDAAVVELRRAVLHELLRRDPAATQHWLNAGAQKPPEQHLRDSRGLTGQRFLEDRS